MGATAGPDTKFEPNPWLWHRRRPDRWKAELAALRATGWDYRITRLRDGRVALLIDYPIPNEDDRGVAGSNKTLGPGTVRIKVRFPDMYPWFGPEFYDHDDRLGLTRHRELVSGRLCLIHDEHRHLDTTVADILSRQMPKLLTTRLPTPIASRRTAEVNLDGSTQQTSAEPSAVAAANRRAVAGDGAFGVRGLLELPVAEPVHVARTFGSDITVPDWDVPTKSRGRKVEGGPLIVRLAFTYGGGIGGGTIEQIGGRGFELTTPIPTTRLERQFPLRGFGRWLRDPDFDPTDSAQETVARIRDRLDRLERPRATESVREVSPDHVEVVGLLVPAERSFRGVPDEQWLFIIRFRERPGRRKSRRQPRVLQATDDQWDDSTDGDGNVDGDFADGNGRARGPWAAIYCTAQHVDIDGINVRTPTAAKLGDKRVLVAGLGAIGSVIAQDLGRTGIGHLTIIDCDTIDCTGSGARQPAPFDRAGMPKVQVMMEALTLNRPTISVTPLDVDLSRLRIGQGDGRSEIKSRQVLSDLGRADLIVDATADPTVTRWLASIAAWRKVPFLHVSATAGAWGGVAALLTPETGCWACVEHWRADTTDPLRIPPADPNGWINPPRCSDITFTGTAPDIAAIASHATRIAIAYLTDGGNLGGDYHVAALATPDGRPQTTTWDSIDVPVHPDCKMHQAATAPTARGSEGYI